MIRLINMLDILNIGVMQVLVFQMFLWTRDVLAVKRWGQKDLECMVTLYSVDI